MCDVCADFLHLLVSYESRISTTDTKHPVLHKNEVEIAFQYIQTWPQRQCMCCYRDLKNFERFNLVVQSLICLCVCQLKGIDVHLDAAAAAAAAEKQNSSNNNSAAGSTSANSSSAGGENAPDSTNTEPSKADNSTVTTGNSSTNAAASEANSSDKEWSLPELEKLFVLVSKAFILNFPLYIAYKHGVHSRLDDISTHEAQNLSMFCDLHDSEIPAFLLRNVTLFCNNGGFTAMIACFGLPNLPVSTAHAITAVISNLKLWLNYRSIVQLFVPLRVKILQYMCKLSDQDLRSPSTRSMADFMWAAIKDPPDSQVAFDTEGLALAFKYFTSTTLTMRLAGMAQINAYINLFNDICTSETVGDVEIVGQKLADWLTEYQIVSHLFGPNLHAEVIKQSHIVLNFLAVENQITEEHVNLIWQAAQLKHCSKPVYDILPSLVKNLAPQPALHLYSLLCRLDPKEHTEQSIYITSALTKLIWSRDGVRQQMDLPPGAASTAAILAHQVGSSSENSVSLDGSNSDEHPDEDSSDGHKSNIDIEGCGSDSGPTPCKQPRHKVCCDETTDDSSKIEEITDELDCSKLSEKIPRANRRQPVSAIIASSSDECKEDADNYVVRRKRRKVRAGGAAAKKHLQKIEAISEPESHSDEIVNANDSDCSDTQLQSAMLGLQGDSSFLGGMSDSHLIDLLSGAENDGSYSSPLSNKSEKNMADFEDEDSPLEEEELAQLAASSHCLAFSPRARHISMNDHFHSAAAAAAAAAAVANGTSLGKASRTIPSSKVAMDDALKDRNRSPYKIAEVCQPGNTLLWDLLMDDKIGQLGESLALEAEKALGTLLCFNTEKLIRTKFIEGCLQNLAQNRSVIVSLRLLPKLLASFQQFRVIDTHQVTMWAERQHKMMHHFFNNLKYYAHTTKQNNQNSNQSIGGSSSSSSSSGSGSGGSGGLQHTQVLNQNGTQMYSHLTQVQVRLQFLTSVFSTMGSPDTFRLSLDQVDALWEWLSNDAECADCLFAWLQGQAKGSDQHALGIDTLQHLYLKKLPELKPEGITMVALGLFQQLCSLARLAAAHYETDSSLDIVGMSHLWKIALRATNTDVSLAAIQYINSYYMGQQLKLEKEFVAHCMNHLTQAADDLNNPDYQENALMCVQRALMLLNTHLDTFRRRYAYHLRRWALEGKGFGPHSALRNDAMGPPIRVILQPGGLPDKSVLHLHTTDLVADLKAEIAKWWEQLQGGAKQSGAEAPVLGLLLSEGPLRIITQGQEITAEYDERSLADVGFKDNQMVYVSLGGRSVRKKEPNDHPSLQPPPPKECLPTVLLLQPNYFEELFKLMQTLGDMKSPNKTGPNTKAQLLSRRVWDILAMLPTSPDILNKFKLLARYESASISSKSGAVSHNSLIGDDSGAHKMDTTESTIDDKYQQQIQELLDPNNLQKFMYSLHIVESLSKAKQHTGCCGNENNLKIIQPKPKSMYSKLHQRQQKAQQEQKKAVKAAAAAAAAASTTKETATPSATEEIKETPSNDSMPTASKAIAEDVKSDSKTERLNVKDTETSADSKSTSESEKESSSTIEKKQQEPKIPTLSARWNDIFIRRGGLRHLFDIFMSGMLQSENGADDCNEWRNDCLASLLRILCLLGVEEMKPEDSLLIVPELNEHMLQMMVAKPTLQRLASILNDAGLPSNSHHFKTGFWGRAQVIHFTMNLLVCLVHSSAQAREYLWTEPDICGWLQRFILDDPEPAVRREACAGLYRICLGNSVAYHSLLVPLLSKLISFLPTAEKMILQNPNPNFTVDDGKEPYGPACRDYFWLLCRLVDTLTPDMVKECLDEPSPGTLDIEQLCRQVAACILKRGYLETRYSNQDDGLVGLINLMTNLVKFDPPYKFNIESQQLISEIFDCLFDLPSPAYRQKPKCKSQSSRAAAYDLLAELSRNCPINFTILHSKLMDQHRPGPHSPYPWDYWPRDDGRSECGYVGLTNLGATCYMASCIQHLFMMPQARESILSIEPDGAQKHATTLHELQRMFAYLMESERKSYNPRSFCRVYQMDHQPLNTGEQKDMAEFFIDLVSKLEEMTPDLKTLIKRLFCGTLSNNVVSLDCGHVSRTLEEFYTVRCQVADMRNLQESLDEVTVKDTLEGDNMYTCSQCGRKVRAEKRACFKKLPQILCFNTMRYTFNMITMLKEKVNTHFSFPLRLDMSAYAEKTLMPQHYQASKRKTREHLLSQSESSSDRSSPQQQQTPSNSGGTEPMDTSEPMVGGATDKNFSESENQLSVDHQDEEPDQLSGYFEYDLVGVTVHTGTADGGHYYSFIKERNLPKGMQDRWFLFNDAEVKIFDPSQIAAECFGGEMISKTYDSVTEKYLDFSFEKTNSAYMLFYERRQTNDRFDQEYLMDNMIPSSSTSSIGDLVSATIKQVASCSTDIVAAAEAAAIMLNAEKVAQAAAAVAAAAKSDDNSKPTINVSSETDTKCESSNLIGNKCDIANKDKDGNDSNTVIATTTTTTTTPTPTPVATVIVPRTSLLSKELEEWIWQDNRHFLQDRNIFEHTYFNFMWQICGHIPQTLLLQTDVTCIATQLSVSFFIETFIHAKEKPTMVLWVELLTKQFNANQEACEWFLTHMSTEPWWPVQVLIQCPNQMVRQMFQRLVIHVIQRLRSSHYGSYLKTETTEDDKEVIGNASCVTRFIKSLILLMEHGAKAHLRHLSEFFGLLYEFSRMGEEEGLFLLKINVIRSVADFYLGHKTQDCIEATSDNDDNSSDEALSVDKARPASLDKMIALVASLVERSRGTDLRLHLSARDYNAIAGGKGFPFLYQQIKDNINPQQTRHLIHALCRWDERLANQIITMLFTSVTRHTELCGPFFKLLTLLTDSSGGPSGLPCFSQLVLQRVWDAAEYCPQSALDWLAVQAPRNKIAHAWILQSAESWVEQFLLSHNNNRVRNAAAYLLVSLVPSQSFRANYRATSLKLPTHTTQRELSGDAQIILHTILSLLLRLLRAARSYTDYSIHGTNKLTAYFGLMTYCMVSKTEKIMLGPYIRTLWELFHPRLSEPSVPAHHNKQALLAFWHHSSYDCSENAQLMANCPEITRNIAFNYILADHEDAEIVAYNRAMLPAYYGLLRFCCQQSRALTRQLAAHQNLQWAFKNITPHPTQYAMAVDELFRLMTLFATRHPDATDAEQREVSTFRRTTMSAYLSGLDARVSWGTLIAALRILVDNEEDRLFVVFSGGIAMCFEALHTLHSMYHEATACHVSGDLQELLTELVLLCSILRTNVRDQKKRPPAAAIKGLSEAVRRLTTLLNTYNPPEMRILAFDVLNELVRNSNLEVTSILASIFTHCHIQAHNAPSSIGPLGPYFPRRGTKAHWPNVSKSNPRPPRPMVQISIPQYQIIQKGTDRDFDVGLEAFFRPYHDFLDVMLRMAVNTNQLNESLVNLSCLAGIEAAALHFNLFPKFWVGIYNNKSTNKYVDLLTTNGYLLDYIDVVLRNERISMNDPVILNFIEIYLPKVSSRIPVPRLIDTICQNLISKENHEIICGDLLIVRVIAQSCGGFPASVRHQLHNCLKSIMARLKDDFSKDEETPPKKRKLNPSEQITESATATTPTCSSSSLNENVEDITENDVSANKISSPKDAVETLINKKTDDFSEKTDDNSTANCTSSESSSTTTTPVTPTATSSTPTTTTTTTSKDDSKDKPIERNVLKTIENTLEIIFEYFLDSGTGITNASSNPLPPPTASKPQPTQTTNENTAQTSSKSEETDAAIQTTSTAATTTTTKTTITTTTATTSTATTTLSKNDSPTEPTEE